jgi:hypothetical protein
MCMGNVCPLTNAVEWDHISASWITNQTGWSVIPNSQIGYILTPTGAAASSSSDSPLVKDPTASPPLLQVQCVYPTDAMTMGRSRGGCGPLLQDPLYGDAGYARSTWWYRRQVKRALERLLQLNFGSASVDTSQLPCEAVIPLGHFGPMVPPMVWTTTLNAKSGSATTAGNGDHDIQVLPSLLSVLVDQYSAFLGRPLCNINATIVQERGYWVVNDDFHGVHDDRYPDDRHLVDDYYHRAAADDDDDRYRDDGHLVDDYYHRTDDDDRYLDDRYAHEDDQYPDDDVVRNVHNKARADGIGTNPTTTASVATDRSLQSARSHTKDQDPPDDDDLGTMWWYVGPKSWPASQWSEAMQILMDSFISPNNTVWNEVVLATPVTMRSLVSAVFFAESPNADENATLHLMALQQARLLSVGTARGLDTIVPVLMVPLTRWNTTAPDTTTAPLLVCADDADSGDSSRAKARQRKRAPSRASMTTLPSWINLFERLR